MRIKIKDTDKVPMWALPEANLHLSFENNDFVSIEPAKLPGFACKVLWLNLAHGILECEGMEELEALIIGPKVRDEPKTELNLIQKGRKSVDLVEKVTGLKSLLNHNVSSLRRFLPERNIEELRVLFNLEEKGKNRKTVLALTSELIKKFDKTRQEQATESASKEDGHAVKTSTFTGREKLFAGQLTDIEETVEKDIIIHIGEPSSDDSG